MVRRSTSHSSARSSRVMPRRASNRRMMVCSLPAWEYFFAGLPFCIFPPCRNPFIDYNWTVNSLYFEGYCNLLNHFDNQFLTYAVALHDWINQPGYLTLFLLSFLASS